MSLFPRGRISDAIRDSAKHGVAVLVAPAGFGKSEAIRDAYTDAVRVVMPADDDTSVETIARLVIEAAVPTARRALKPLLQRPREPETRAHLATWCAAKVRSLREPIVFEDFEGVGDATSLLFVRRLIESTVPQTRWVIASRTTPDLPLIAWFADGLMTVPITAEDLGFKRNEAGGLAEAMGIQIDGASLTSLVAEVGDWPLALRLSLSFWDRTRALPPLRIRTRPALYDYLRTEVWEHRSGWGYHDVLLASTGSLDGFR